MVYAINLALGQSSIVNQFFTIAMVLARQSLALQLVRYFWGL